MLAEILIFLLSRAVVFLRNGGFKALIGARGVAIANGD